jgi:hypothetical protein
MAHSMLSLITGQVFNNPITTAQEDLFSLSPPPSIDGKRPASSASSSQRSSEYSQKKSLDQNPGARSTKAGGSQSLIPVLE